MIVRTRSWMSRRNHDPAIAGDVAREQQVHVVEVPGEEDSPRDPAHADAAGAVINRVDIVFPLRIVEFRRAPIAALEWDFR